jgi:hypothetical protein
VVKNGGGAIPLRKQVENERNDEIGSGREEEGSPVHNDGEPALHNTDEPMIKKIGVSNEPLSGMESR